MMLEPVVEAFRALEATRAANSAEAFIWSRIVRSESMAATVPPAASATAPRLSAAAARADSASEATSDSE